MHKKVNGQIGYTGRERKVEKIFRFWHLHIHKKMNTCCYRTIETHDKGVCSWMEVKPF